MKNKLFVLILTIVIVLLISIPLLFIKSKSLKNFTEDVEKTIVINNKDINTLYKDGNMIDVSLTYGNTLEKIIELKNENDEDEVVSVNLKDLKVNNEISTYKIYYSIDGEDFKVLKDEQKLTDKLVYNLVIYKNSKMTLKIIFRGLSEESDTHISGELSVDNNLSKKDIFLNKLVDVHNKVTEKIKSLNGINESGIYYLKVSEEDINGYALIDAQNISEIKYIYSLYNKSYMILNYKYKGSFSKKGIKENDLSINNMNENDICKLYSKKSCNDFSSLNYSSVGKNDFYQETLHIIEEVKNRTYDKNVYIVDVANDLNRQNIRGYVLVNNTDGNKEIYLYLTNDLFMISGYNLTKLGNFDENSTTIRAYNESAFNLSSKDMPTVCSFSGFNQCFNLQNELV